MGYADLCFDDISGIFELIGFTPPHFCVCPILGVEFKFENVFFVVLNALRVYVALWFVDTSGIVDNQCLTFLSIIGGKATQYFSLK